MSDASELYGRDYHAWANRQIDALSAGRFADLDIAHLLEELRDMGRSERNELENRLVILLAHLLKWQFQYGQISDRWKEFPIRSGQDLAGLRFSRRRDDQRRSAWCAPSWRHRRGFSSRTWGTCPVSSRQTDHLQGRRGGPWLNFLQAGTASTWSCF